MKSEILSLSGEVEGFNISPDGYPESMLLRVDGGLVQVNLPDDADPDAFAGFEVGQEAKVEAVPYEDEEGDHPVYEMIPPAETWTGRVKRINYALHGEPNGVVLESGELIHLKPPRARAAGLTVGDEIRVEGVSFTSEFGHTVIEPVTLNGLSVDKLKKKKKG